MGSTVLWTNRVEAGLLRMNLAAKDRDSGLFEPLYYLENQLEGCRRAAKRETQE